MEGIEKIIEKIKEDCNIECRKIEEETQAQCEKIRRECEAQIASMEMVGDKNVQQKTEDYRKQIQNEIAATEKMKLLSAKQSCIERTFSLACQKAGKLDKGERIKLAIGLARNAQLPKYGDVVMTKKDRAEIGGEFIQAINAAHNANLALSEATAEIFGGAMVLNGKVTYDLSLRTQINGMKSQMSSALVPILFPKGEMQE